MSRPPSSIAGRRSPRAGAGGAGAGGELPRSDFCISVSGNTARKKGLDRLNTATSVTAAQGQADLVAEVEALGERLRLVRQRIGEVIFGQAEVVEQALITLLSGGHALLIGGPGLAKTRLVETLGTILGPDDKRIQCTPDLMPADTLGSQVLEGSESGRRPIRFNSRSAVWPLLMADEIQRPMP